jgi:predicted phosphodiesterase
MLWGNHDIVKKNKKYVQKNFYSFYDEHEKTYKPLFEGIEFEEALILKHSETGRKLFLVHGHQGDLINDQLWPIGRFLVRNLWRRLELLGVHDPTSAAKNYRKKNKLEKKIADWAAEKNQTIIIGHTHQPVFPYADEDLYFNDGSCVHPRCISGIEIEDGNITLIKWSVKTKSGGTLYVGRDIIAGPAKLDLYFRSRVFKASLL